MVSREIRAWDNYWKRGEINSCISGENSEYQNEVNQFWQEFFADFDNDICLLDIGTGNGLLPVLAVDVANEKNFSWEVHGVDLADIDPEKYVRACTEELSQINFQGRIAAEALPFEDRYFDGVTSQYAIEYGTLSKSIPEISRVLKKSGQFCAVLHARDSIVVQQNIENMTEADFLLGNTIFDSCKKLLSRAYASGRNMDGIADVYIAQVESLAGSFQENIRPNIIPKMQQTLLEILRLSPQYSLSQVLEMVDNAVIRLQGQRAILADLVNSSLDKTQEDQLVEMMIEAGFKDIKISEFRIGAKNILLGICIKAQMK